MTAKTKRICVFCGSLPGNQELYKKCANEVGIRIAKRGFDLVYGGASKGLMGILSAAAKENGGKLIGVIPKYLVDKEKPHLEGEELVIVESLERRKQVMEEVSDEFIILPGGIGTLEETFEILSKNMIGVINKKCLILNVDNYFGDIIRFINHSIEKEFTQNFETANLVVCNSVEKLIDEI